MVVSTCLAEHHCPITSDRPRLQAGRDVQVCPVLWVWIARCNSGAPTTWNLKPLDISVNQVSPSCEFHLEHVESDLAATQYFIGTDVIPLPRLDVDFQ